jgi:hypothetical protein
LPFRKFKYFIEILFSLIFICDLIYFWIDGFEIGDWGLLRSQVSLEFNEWGSGERIVTVNGSIF